MSNQMLNISMITREALRILENSLTFAKGVNRDYDDQFAISGAKIGDTLNVRKPARYVVREGRVINIQNHVETSVPLVLNRQIGVDVQFTSKDMALSLDDFSDRVLKPAVATIANKIDFDGLSLYHEVPNFVGVPGTTPTTLKTYLQAGAALDNEATPRDGLRRVVINPAANVEIVDALKGLHHSGARIGKQFEKGLMAKEVAGFDWFMDQNIVSHTVGQLGGTPLVDLGGQTGSTINLKGWTAAAATRLKKGDVITFAGVYAVNPQSRQSTGQLRQFTVTEDCASDVSGDMAVKIYPAIVTSGAFQNVTAAPENEAAVKTFGEVSSLANKVSPVNLAYHRDAFVLGCADLPLPGGVDKAARVSDKQLGLSIRMIRDYDINNDNWPCRLDILYGWKTVYPELACRVMG